jgi:peptidoglycan/LPS O-acetylase OafA/YrhL
MLYTFTNCRMDALALGAAVATIESSPAWRAWIAGHRRELLITIVGLLIVTALFSHTYSVFDPRTLLVGQTVLAAAFALLIACIASIPAGARYRLSGLLEMSWLRRVGRYSYAMYIFHLLILTAFGPVLTRWLAFSGSAYPLLYALAAVVLSFIAGWLSYQLIEKRFLALKSHIVPKPASRVAHSA